MPNIRKYWRTASTMSNVYCCTHIAMLCSDCIRMYNVVFRLYTHVQCCVLTAHTCTVLCSDCTHLFNVVFRLHTHLQCGVQIAHTFAMWCSDCTHICNVVFRLHTHLQCGVQIAHTFAMWCSDCTHICNVNAHICSTSMRPSWGRSICYPSYFWRTST